MPIQLILAFILTISGFILFEINDAPLWASGLLLIIFGLFFYSEYSKNQP